MKKITSILLTLAMVAGCLFAFAGCSKGNNGPYDIVLITDGATITDGGYNESAWNGIQSYCDENSLQCKYYQPSLNDDGELEKDTINDYIDLAVKDGAKYVVLPGDDFAVSMVEYAPTYSDVNFILVGAMPHTAGGVDYGQSNVMSITFDELQAGFLAGYCSVLDGYTKLGYLGAVNDYSARYGTGFVQGAAYCADEKGIPVTLDYANYDATDLDYDYSINIRAVYDDVDNVDGKKFKVNVENGLGSGVYTDGENVKITANLAPEGKKFDHWDVKSDTDGVKDRKVNVSSKKDGEINLLVGDCDCTITAVYADATTYSITIPENGDSTKVAQVIYAEADSTNWVVAPAAEPGYVFDHWECNDPEAVEDENSAGTNVKVTDHGMLLTPCYVESDEPTFNVVVENGTGSGSYMLGDNVYLVADAPEEGKMFVKWENVDNQGLSTGISMENEYNYTTSFEMVDRYASVVEKMYDDGTQVVFGGGNPQFESIFTATWNFDYQVYAYGCGVDQGSMGNCVASVVTDYGAAIKLALDNFAGGSVLTGNCNNECIYVTGKSKNAEDEEYNEQFTNVYAALANGDLIVSNADASSVNDSSCLTLNYWIKTPDEELATEENADVDTAVENDAQESEVAEEGIETQEADVD